MWQKQVEASSRNSGMNVGRFLHKKRIPIVFTILLVLSTSFLLESTVATGKQYTLVLSVKHQLSRIILTACLTVNQGHNRKEPVAEAMIYFYRCNHAGRDLTEIGHSITRHDGKAIFQWSAPSNGNYWFIAAYRLGRPEREM